MTNEQLRHIFVEILDGRGRHGSFLKSFALAVANADPFNFEILAPAMEELVAKYELQKYLDNYEANQ